MRPFYLDWAKIRKVPLDDVPAGRSDHAWNTKLAGMIREYWASHGFNVNIEVVKQPPRNQSEEPLYYLKSDLINGMPRDAKPV